MKRSFQFVFFSLMLSTLVVLIPGESAAQCPMCKMSAESNMRDGGTEGKGLNTGILYMFSLPYLLVGTLGFLWYKNRKREEPFDS
jgi:hypothetical protein